MVMLPLHVDGDGWPWVIVRVIWMVFFLALLVTLLVVWFRGRPYRRGAGRPSAEEVLAERFARGEIDAEEYRTRLATLRERRA